MIKTSQQLKALVRNLSGGNSAKAQVFMRSYAVERFLERLSLSSYRENIVLKGGTLVASLIGVEKRTTVDIDTTVISLPLTIADVKELVEKVIAIPLDDGISFSIEGIEPIMEGFEYPGIRVSLEAHLERIRTPFRIDFSTDDVITPREISYPFKLLFEDREISILAYNVETVLAEKLETIITRSIGNTRMRDYYDVYALTTVLSETIDYGVLRAAYTNTCKKRGASTDKETITKYVDDIQGDQSMADSWRSYQKRFNYAAGVEWQTASMAVRSTLERAGII